MSMFLEKEHSKTYKRDQRTSFWVSVKYDESSGYVIYVAECLKDWFAYRFPNFYKSAGSRWLISSNGKSYISVDLFASFDLDWVELDRVLQCLGNECFWPNILKPTGGASSNLDVCIVRDYTSNTQDLSHWSYMGGLFHNAKYGADVSISDRNAMIEQLSIAIADMIDCTLGISDGLTQTSFPSIVISSMPIDPENMYDSLEYKMCASVSAALQLPFVSPFVRRLHKRQVKGMSLVEKNSYWDSLINDKCIAVNEAVVRDKVVILVDDLYQSGLSMEKTAQFLKSCGAIKVYGFACVKAMRDSDNT